MELEAMLRGSSMSRESLRAAMSTVTGTERTRLHEIPGLRCAMMMNSASIGRVIGHDLLGRAETAKCSPETTYLRLRAAATSGSSYVLSMGLDSALTATR